MTVDEFLVWAEAQPGRWELYNGVPYAMAPERAGHGKVKFARSDGSRAGHPQGRPAVSACCPTARRFVCRSTPRTSRTPWSTAGPKLSDDAIEVPNPVVVVEVASPSTRRIDASLKLTGYFGLPSVQHYLIVDPDGPPVVHHRRQADGTILTSIIHDGTLALTPPGIEVAVAELFGLPEPPEAAAT